MGTILNEAKFWYTVVANACSIMIDFRAFRLVFFVGYPDMTVSVNGK